MRKRASNFDVDFLLAAVAAFFFVSFSFRLRIFACIVGGGGVVVVAARSLANKSKTTHSTIIILRMLF